MISHKYKCIFIHIQRTAGTSIEQWICGMDWWMVDEATKHLLASQAKIIYKDYWDEYFKFSFVRNPVDRVVSCLKFSDHFGIKADGHGNIDFSDYLEMYGDDVTLEHDQRFYKRENLIKDKHKEGSVYSNIIDEEVDFVGKFENLIADTHALRQILNIEAKFDYHAEKFESRSLINKINEDSMENIKRLYSRDFSNFGY